MPRPSGNVFAAHSSFTISRFTIRYHFKYQLKNADIKSSFILGAGDRLQRGFTLENELGRDAMEDDAMSRAALRK